MTREEMEALEEGEAIYTRSIHNQLLQLYGQPRVVEDVIRVQEFKKVFDATREVFLTKWSTLPIPRDTSPLLRVS
jgi:hypothetical protein